MMRKFAMGLLAGKVVSLLSWPNSEERPHLVAGDGGNADNLDVLQELLTHQHHQSVADGEDDDLK